MQLAESSNSVEYRIFQIAGIRKFYNPYHQIIRIQRGSGDDVKYYDLKCYPGSEVPQQDNHLVLAALPEATLKNMIEVPERRHDILPGLEDTNGKLADIPQGECFLINQRQTIASTNPQNASAGMFIQDVNTFDLDNLRVALTPPLENRDYTTLDDNKAGNINNLSVGFFINKQGTLVLKSRGGSITLGHEGVHIGGKLATESSTKDTGVLSDNSLSDIIPPFLVGAIPGVKKLPNPGQITSIANAAVKFVEATDKAAKIGSITANLTSAF